MGERNDLTIGMVIAAGIVMRSHGEETIAEEILCSANVQTLAKAKAIGVDQYDIDILRPVFRQLAARQARKSSGRAALAKAREA